MFLNGDAARKAHDSIDGEVLFLDALAGVGLASVTSRVGLTFAASCKVELLISFERKTARMEE